MSTTIKLLFKRLLFGLGAGVILLIVTVLNPVLLYGHESNVAGITIRHDQPLTADFILLVKQAKEVIETSEIYDSAFDVQLCLDDEAFYPRVVKMIKGTGFGHGFYNIALISSKINPKSNRASLNGYHWNLKRLLIHEMIHAYQYNRYGHQTLTKAAWKIEGYAEYVSHEQPASLTDEIGRLIEFNGHKPINQWTWFKNPDGSGVPLNYLKDHLLVRFMMEQRAMSFDRLLSDHRSEEAVLKEMIAWYRKKTSSTDQSLFLY